MTPTITEDDFIQTTGTTRGMTVELMRAGTLHSVGYVVGDTGPTHLPRLDGSTIEVNRNEVLTSDDSASLCAENLGQGDIDTAGWSLRQI